MAAVAAGSVSPDDAARQLRTLPFADLGFARVDHHRHLRQGVPEAVYGIGKTAEQCKAIVGELLGGGSGPVVLTRADHASTLECNCAHPGAEVSSGPASTSTLVWRPRPLEGPKVAVVTAGTSDLPVANEAAAVLVASGIEVVRLTDVGVAGVHRLLASLEELEGCHTIIVVAGMEGALGSVLGGLVACPVVAVPTSTGYGAGLEGVTALLAMLSSCAAGLTVVGIDNGFGAAMAVVRLVRGTPKG